MYKSIYIPLDNSDYSNMAIEVGLSLARQFGATMIGSHAYAAKLHDRRFKQMEAGLPEEYQDEKELERQRKVHDELITRGLLLISNSYIDVIQKRCDGLNIPLVRREPEGKNFKVLVQDVEEAKADLVVLGALGIGAVKDSVIGSVCERMVRRVKTADVLVVKNLQSAPPGKIVVAVDGSGRAFGGVKTAVEIGKAFNVPVEAVSAFDPYFHYAAFTSLVGVLSEEAGKVFRFKEQEKLHEEVIDSGLAKIYQAHLDIAHDVAKENGLEIKTTLLDGKPFEKVLQYVRKEPPWLLVLGRIGVHSDEEMDIGSNTENLLRMVPCNVLISNRVFVPPISTTAEYTMAWTEEAKLRMEKVPVFARGMAKTAIYKYALEKGHTIISNSVVDAAMGEIMPRSAMDRIADLGRVGMKQDAAAQARPAPVVEKPRYICQGCGYVGKGDKPVKCPVCGAGGDRFALLDKAAIEAAAKTEGETERTVAFDDTPIEWTQEAKELIKAQPTGMERRRGKAKVEKSARIMGIRTITKEFAVRIIEAREMATKALTEPGQSPGRSNGMEWSDEARRLLERVPEGLARAMAQSKIEEHVLRAGATTVTPQLAEEGLRQAREAIEQVRSRGRGPGGSPKPKPGA